MQIYCTIDIPSSVKAQIYSEINPIFLDHPEYTWEPSNNIVFKIYSFPDVEEDLLPKLQEKIAELLVDISPFNLFGMEYVVRIRDDIRVMALLQKSHELDMVTRALQGYFGERRIWSREEPEIQLAKYKIPAKQQYSHLKNELAKIRADYEFRASEIRLMLPVQVRRGTEYVEKGKVELLESNG